MQRVLPVLAGCLLLALATAPAAAQQPGSGLLQDEQESAFGSPDADAFRETTITVKAAPAAAVGYALPAGQSIRDFEVSPVGDRVALLIEGADGRQQIAWWRFEAGGFAGHLDVPAGMRIASLAWRPDATRLFLLATDAHGSSLLALDADAKAFTTTPILRSSVPLRRLVVGPRPFFANRDGPAVYRLFFGEQLAQGRFALRSVTEQGQVPYTVVGPALDPQYKGKDESEGPGTTIAPSGLPVGFHPAGDTLVWEDERGCLHRKHYDANAWKPSKAFGNACGTFAAYTPNGAATLSWNAGKPGLQVHGLVDRSDQTVLASERFASVPSQTPDGRGVVGITREGGRTSLHYWPLALPLADVANAWMFLASADDQQRFVRDRGLFRDRPEDKQLYQLYDSESYAGGLDPGAATRPYFVTTDLFWENYGAAFDGLFIVVERERAMPAFRRFLDAAHVAFGKSAPGSGLAKTFDAARAVIEHAEAGNPEAQRLMAANGTLETPLGRMLDYGQLKPRGHYRTEDQKRYFRAMRYLSLLRFSDAEAATLRRLGPDVARPASEWIGSYQPFIAASRLDPVWGGAKAPVASHAGAGGIGLFPLSWAWDNEALDNVIYHDDWPAAEKIVGAGGTRRLLPSGLDFAAILGNADAGKLLADDGLYATYPNLAARIAATARRFDADRRQRKQGTLYEKWMTALATQWADAAATPIAGPLWRAKRLQTGLASWATLRHATILANDQTAAEAGEGGFEEIEMAPPRGYVEPDPATFAAIADLFDATIAVVNARPLLANDPAGDARVRQGIVKRLGRARDDARQFEAIARKELANQPLTAEDYAAIEYVGGTIEHSFLVFMSLSNPSYALSEPEAIMKVADVAGARGEASGAQSRKSGASGGSLEVAVGRPLEWDQIVPFLGRHEIVKGAVYAYYEFTAEEPIDDAAWQAKVDKQARPPWVARFMSKAKLEFPATER